MRLKLAHCLTILFLIAIFYSTSNAEIKVIAHSEVFQGRSFIIFLTSSEAVKNATAVFNGKKIGFFRYEEGLRAIIGTEPEIKAGEYPIHLDMVKNDGKTEARDLSISVSPRKYPIVSFWLKPSKKKLLTPGLIAEEWGIIEAKLIDESKTKLWEREFDIPVPGVTTMYFGTREYINGKPRSRHRGQDFRAKAGTMVKAGNNGKVVIAQFFKAFGGTVVIDHGQGINTLHFHLSKIIAKVGQEVKKGEAIGLSGNTGISSGPHLHWGMSVHNVRVDPIQWVKTIMP